jgi:peptide/nickel transport system substrate-binding protein
MIAAIYRRRNWLDKILAVGAVTLPLILLGAIDAGAQAPKTFRAVMQADIQVLDPLVNMSGSGSRIAHMVFETLFALDQDLVPQPQMVSKYDITPDGLIYTFVLRPGLKFHDGAPVTADDVVASLMRWWVKDGGGQILHKFTKELTAIDDQTIKLVLNQPYGLVLDTLAKPVTNVPVIMPKRLAQTDPNQAVADIVGSGPFKFIKEAWQPGNKIVFVKNSDYVPRSEPPNGFAGGKVAKVDRVEWITLPDPQTAVQALSRGEIDFIEQPLIDLLPMLKTNKDVRIETLTPLGVQGILRLNHLQPPFTDVRVRHAVQWLLSQRDLMTAAFGDSPMWQVCGSILICNQPMAFQDGAEMLNNDIPEPERIAKARALLQEAGYKGEPVVLLDPVNYPVFHAVNLVFAQALKKAGMNVEVAAMDWATLVARRANRGLTGQGGWSMFFTSNGGLEASNPSFNASLAADCDKAWFGWPCDQKMQELRSSWALARTLDERKAIARQFQIQANDTVVYIPYGVWKAPSAFRTNVRGMLKVPDAIVFWNVEKN